jgi:poly [ADP-ribose] polymerase
MKQYEDENGTVIAVPNQTYIQMRLVKFNATNGVNKTVTMKADSDGKTFQLISGDIGRKYGRKAPKARKCPIETWDDTFWCQIDHGYKVVATEEAEEKEVVTSNTKPIDDPDVADIVQILLDACNKVIEEQYSSVKITDIPDADLQKAQEIIKLLQDKKDKLSVPEFNRYLLELWTVIPRVMRNMNKHKCLSKEQFSDTIQAEQDLLDFLKSMLRSSDKQEAGKTILETNGIEMTSCSDEEVAMLKEMMTDQRSRFLRAWKVKNIATEERFNEYCKNRKIDLNGDGVTRLFHGSGTPNWWSIITNGLYLNPDGVTIHGKMFGYGLYFAPYSRKSIGYTSSYGSYWAHGDCSKGYLAVFKVATGKVYDVYNDTEYNNYVPNTVVDFEQNVPDHDCLWAMSSKKASMSRLVNDEVIVYREEQATIEYLIEFSA